MMVHKSDRKGCNSHPRFARSERLLNQMWNLIVVLILGFVIWHVSAEPRGKLVAHVDLMFGRHKGFAYGHEKAWTGEYRLLLKQRFRIEIEVDDSSDHRYADGYNSVSVETAVAKYGEDSLRLLYQEVEDRWKSKKY